MRDIQFGFEQMTESSRTHQQVVLGPHHAQHPLDRPAHLVVINAAYRGQRYHMRSDPRSTLYLAAGPVASFGCLPGANQVPGRLSGTSAPGVPCSASVA